MPCTHVNGSAGVSGARPINRKEIPDLARSMCRFGRQSVAAFCGLGGRERPGQPSSRLRSGSVGGEELVDSRLCVLFDLPVVGIVDRCQEHVEVAEAFLVVGEPMTDERPGG